MPDNETHPHPHPPRHRHRKRKYPHPRRPHNKPNLSTKDSDIAAPDRLTHTDTVVQETEEVFPEDSIKRQLGPGVPVKRWKKKKGGSRVGDVRRRLGWGCGCGCQPVVWTWYPGSTCAVVEGRGWYSDGGLGEGIVVDTMVEEVGYMPPWGVEYWAERVAREGLWRGFRAKEEDGCSGEWSALRYMTREWWDGLSLDVRHLETRCLDDGGEEREEDERRSGGRGKQREDEICCTRTMVEEEIASNVIEKGPVLISGRDEWDCDFCGMECFCWVVGK